MRTFLYLKDQIAEFVNYDVELREGDIVFLDGLPYTVINTLYKVVIINKRAELEKQIYLEAGVIKK